MKRGFSVITVLILLILVIGGFVGVKFIMAYIDVSGIAKDVEAKFEDLTFSRTINYSKEVLGLAKARGLDIDDDDVNYDEEKNVIVISGVKVIDFLVFKYKWRFKHTVYLKRKLKRKKDEDSEDYDPGG